MGRATFGEFVQSAHRHLAGTAAPHHAGGTGGNVEEVSRSLLRVVIIMGRYLRDIATSFHDLSGDTGSALAPWSRACLQASEAATNAAGFLIRRGPPSRWPAAPAASPLAQRLDAVAVSLATGRDLLQTHFAADSHGAPQQRSEWGLVITSAPVTRALLAEIGALARQTAQHGANLALSPFPGTRGNGNARRRLSAACQWLWVLDASVRAAHQLEPVTEADRELLRAIPVNAIPERPLLTGGEPVSSLREGVTSTAERARHLAWASAYRASRPPGVSAMSLRKVADAGTVTSHHCHLLLHALAARSAQAGLTEVSGHLSAAADAAAHARDRWLQAARAVRRITTDTRAYLSAVAGEASDLALWTGRLAYADPAWTLASGPAHPVRPPESLAPQPHDLPLAVTAVHQACHTLTTLTHTEQDQIRTAAQAGRILVPTQSLPDTYDIPHPFARAPHDRIDLLLAHYADAGQASRQATAAVEEAVEATGAPSRVLTAARAAATGASRRASPEHASGRPAGPATRPGAVDDRPEPADRPGPVEHTLRRLGITRPELLSRGADIDRASERLIIDAAADLEPSQHRPSAVELNTSTGTTALINHALASGDPRATALLRRPDPPSREPPEPEAEP